MTRTGLAGQSCACTDAARVRSNAARSFLMGFASSLFEVRHRAGGGGETEIAALDDRLAPAVQREQLGLPSAGAAIDLHRIANLVQLAPAQLARLCVLRVRREIVDLVRVGLEIEKLRGVLGIVHVLPLADADCESPSARAHAVVLGEHRALRLRPARDVEEGNAGISRRYRHADAFQNGRQRQRGSPAYPRAYPRAVPAPRR